MQSWRECHAEPAAAAKHLGPSVSSAFPVPSSFPRRTRDDKMASIFLAASCPNEIGLAGQDENNQSSAA